MLTTSGSAKRVIDDTARLRQAIQEDIALKQLQKRGQPSLVVLSGLPGTGKSHFAGALNQRLPLLVVSSDRMRKLLVPRPKYTRAEHSRIFAACHRLVAELLTEGRKVVFDAAHLTERARQPAYDIAQRVGAPLILVWFTAPQEVIRRRLDDRAAGLNSNSYSDAGWEVYCRLSPGVEPIARPHLSVDSGQDISWSLDQVVSWIESS